MEAQLIDYLTFWDVAVFFGVPLGLLIYTVIHVYRLRQSIGRDRAARHAPSKRSSNHVFFEHHRKQDDRSQLH
jgi:hypothetical protein